jgi:hypothetical protein
MLDHEEVKLYVTHFREMYGHRMTNNDLLRFSCIYESFKRSARRNPKDDFVIPWEVEVMYMKDTFGLDPREVFGHKKRTLAWPEWDERRGVIYKQVHVPQIGLLLNEPELREAFRTYFGRNADRFRREVDDLRNMI